MVHGHVPVKKKLIIFDLDGTLTDSKVRVDAEMASLLCALLTHRKVGVTSGAQFSRFQTQLLSNLRCTPAQWRNLFILPTSGAALYRRRGRVWKKIYEHVLTSNAKRKIRAALDTALAQAHFRVPKKTYGSILEDRGTQITFSALGQRAPLRVKRKWNLTRDMREKIFTHLTPLLPGFVVTIAGLTSIDVTRRGIDKVYGITRVRKLCRYSLRDVAYVGDALYTHGNDYVVKKAGIPTVSVKGPNDTKKLIRHVLSTLAAGIR